MFLEFDNEEIVQDGRQNTESAQVSTTRSKKNKKKNKLGSGIASAALGGGIEIAENNIDHDHLPPIINNHLQQNHYEHENEEYSSNKYQHEEENHESLKKNIDDNNENYHNNADEDDYYYQQMDKKKYNQEEDQNDISDEPDFQQRLQQLQGMLFLIKFDF